MDLSHIKQYYSSLNKQYHIQKGRQEELKNIKKEKIKKVENLNQNLDIYTQARLLLQDASVKAREQAKYTIESMVTKALQYIISPDMSFEVELTESGNKPVAEFYVVSEHDGLIVRNRPADARGGGIADVVSLALRLALLQSSRPEIDAPLILDEPGKHISEMYIKNVAGFLQEISKSFDRQIIMVTHNKYLAEIGDSSFRVELKDGESQVTKVDI
ncbi:MAG: ATP-binding protein [Clostridia bacterium]|nr:ATP-binding protein [Clostridia bacterium]